jgi:protein gp37
MSATRIDWADEVWNPVWGCTGSCPYCYARKMAKRFGIVVDGRRYKDFEPRWIERNFNRPFPRKSSRIFVNSMSDVADWEPKWFNRVVGRILHHPEHLFLFLSKRTWSVDLGFKAVKNIMLGYSADGRFAYEQLLDCGYKNVSFLSVEPLLDPIPFINYLHGPKLLWIIVGAETGNRKDRVVPQLEWLREINNFAWINKIPLFFKESLRRIWPWKLPQEYPTWPRR